MKRKMAAFGLMLVVLIASPAATFAQTGDAESASMSLYLVVPEAEPTVMLDGFQVVMMLAGLGVALILTSTVLKAMYSRHRG